MLIGLLARKRHGKDTVADYLVSKYDFIKKAFASPMKDGIGKQIFGLTDDELYGDSKEVVNEYWGVTPRQILEFVGTEMFRECIQALLPGIESTFWIKVFLKWFIDNKDKNIAICDVRFQNECDAIHKEGGIIIKIERPSIPKPENAHISEEGIDLITDWDYTLLNNGTLEDLYRKVDLLMSSL